LICATAGVNILMMTKLHNRMPVVFSEKEWEEWLDPVTSVDTARAMCMPCQSE
jgi:putative SOS response-associated peptidase YedK